MRGFWSARSKTPAPSGSGPPAEQAQLQQAGPGRHPSADMGPGATSSSRAGEPGLLSRLIRRASMRRSTGGVAAINNSVGADAADARRGGAPPTNTGSTSGGASEVVGAAPGKQADEVYAGRAGESRRSKLHKISKAPAASPKEPASAPIDVAPTKKRNNLRPKSMLPTQNAMAPPSTAQSTKLRTKPSFRDRFWAASSSNDFGSDDSKENVATKPTTPRTAYVPRHAASDFSETTVNRRHRRAVSHDSAVRSVAHMSMPAVAERTTPLASKRSTMPALAERTYNERNQQQQQQQQHTNSFDAQGRGPGSQYEHMAHRGASFHARASAGAFAYASPPAQPYQQQQRDLCDDEDDNPFLDISEKTQRRPAPQPPVAEEGEFTDYDRFVARAHAEEMTIRVDAVRRSWREGKRDSACYSGKRGSARTSEEGSGTGDETGIVSHGLPAAGPGLRRQSSVAQKIAEYIKPPREEGLVRPERAAGRMGVVMEV